MLKLLKKGGSAKILFAQEAPKTIGSARALALARNAIALPSEVTQAAYDPAASVPESSGTKKNHSSTEKQKPQSKKIKVMPHLCFLFFCSISFSIYSTM